MSNKIRAELISSKLKELENSLHYIKEFIPSNFHLLENRKNKNALYKETEFAIQLMIDICAVINSDITKTAPFDEDSIITSLRKEKVLSPDISDKMLTMKGFRNVLVHRYDKIDDKRAFDSIKSGINDFEIFIKEIEVFLKKRIN